MEINNTISPIWPQLPEGDHKLPCTADKVAKRISFSGLDQISTCTGLIIPFTSSEGGRQTPIKTRYTTTYLDAEGNKLRFAKLSKREPQNLSGWIQREKTEGSVNDILTQSNLQPILSKKLDTELERILELLTRSFNPDDINDSFKLLRHFAEHIIQDESSDFMDIQLAIKAIVTCNLYISSRSCLKHSPSKAQEFCDTVADDIYQCIASYYDKQTRSMELILMMSAYFESREETSYESVELNCIKAVFVSLTLDDLFTRILPLFVENT